MFSDLPPGITEYLVSYNRDLPQRWTAQDLQAQSEFVGQALGQRPYLDLSKEEAVLHLWQNKVFSTGVGFGEQFQAAVLASPVTEVMDPQWVLSFAVQQLTLGGQIAAIIPCLRDNSPPNQAFAKLAEDYLWPIFTVDELLEMTAELGLTAHLPPTGFYPVEKFKQSLGEKSFIFSAFNKVADALISQGFDPMALGWGELRLSASIIEQKAVIS